jgi:hypothetical protein
MVGFEYKPSDYIADANTSVYLSVTSIPKRSDWQCYLFGDADRPGPGAIVFTPIEGNEPNWFHRKMQRLCFGIQWRKKK